MGGETSDFKPGVNISSLLTQCLRSIETTWGLKQTVVTVVYSEGLNLSDTYLFVSTGIRTVSVRVYRTGYGWCDRVGWVKRRERGRGRGEVRVTCRESWSLCVLRRLGSLD